ncbi:helix-turn-helix transcriptional regulator [Pedobacter sp. Leaf170]|uniref:helix-turn-helix domain-containing protein n=1 Tax=Pedobacter sp. Leaf170 TaxID=2876558 RepID=UPI001E28AB92|nr:helix-turn-helix transcriptional regulator [Pedobacter sp. Leaf170]
MENLSKRATSKKVITKANPSVEAERFRTFRKANNLSQVEMAEFLKCSQPQINKYESGANLIPIEVPKLLHNKLQLNYEWFYHGKGSMKTVVKKPTLNDTIELSSEVKRLTEEVASLKSMVKDLVKKVYDKATN